MTSVTVTLKSPSNRITISNSDNHRLDDMKATARSSVLLGTPPFI